MTLGLLLTVLWAWSGSDVEIELSFPDSFWSCPSTPACSQNAATAPLHTAATARCRAPVSYSGCGAIMPVEESQAVTEKEQPRVRHRGRHSSRLPQSEVESAPSASKAEEER